GIQSTGVQQIFDRNIKRIQRDNSVNNAELSREVDYLKDEIAERIVDRLLDIKRRFSLVVDMGAGSGHVIKALDMGLLDHIIQTDISEKMLNRDKKVKYESCLFIILLNQLLIFQEVPTTRKVLDEENLLEYFKKDSVDAVLSSLSLHWVNDLPGTLIQVRHILKNDGVFIGAMFGGDTLFELR
ncbi:hypothetical protein HK096_009209, partial [Nowakowskiella sp. JEL0078]